MWHKATPKLRYHYLNSSLLHFSLKNKPKTHQEKQEYNIKGVGIPIGNSWSSNWIHILLVDAWMASCMATVERFGQIREILSCKDLYGHDRLFCLTLRSWICVHNLHKLGHIHGHHTANPLREVRPPCSLRCRILKAQDQRRRRCFV